MLVSLSGPKLVDLQTTDESPWDQHPQPIFASRPTTRLKP